jgi:hypothetical protein
MDRHFANQLAILEQIERSLCEQPVPEGTDDATPPQFADLEFQIVQLLSNHKAIYGQLNSKLKVIEGNKHTAEIHIANSKGKHYVKSSLHDKYESCKNIPEVQSLKRLSIDPDIVEALEHGTELQAVETADKQIEEFLNQEYQVRSLETQEPEVRPFKIDQEQRRISQALERGRRRREAVHRRTQEHYDRYFGQIQEIHTGV